MRKSITLFFVMLSAGAIAQVSPGNAPASQQRQGLLARLRGETQSTRQQLQNQPAEIAQPANNQGYRPGVTFPQAQQQPQQPVAPPPGYPAPTQRLPYNMQPGVQPQPGMQPARPTQTPTRSRSTSEDENESRSSSSSRSGSSTRSKSDDNDSDSSSKKSSSKEDTSEKSASEKKSSDNSEKKTSDNESAKKESSANSSALEKIVKKVESGSKNDAKVEKKEQAPELSKEEKEAARAREAALKQADMATTAVADFLTQANNGLYSKANEHLAPAIKKYFDSEISAVNGTEKNVLDELTGNGNITMVTYVNTTVRGEGAVVEAQLGYQDGRTVTRSFDLIQLDGEWKIVLPVTDEAVAAHKQSVTAPSAPVSAAAPAPAAANQAAPSNIPTAEQAANTPLVLAPGAVNQDAPTTGPK